MDIHVSSKSSINSSDLPFVSDIQQLLVGKDDKSISLLENGSLISILAQVAFTKVDSNTGYFEIPLVDNTKILVQWGRVDAPAAASTNFNYNKTFSDSPFVVIGGLTFTSTDTTIIKADKVSNSQFKIRNTDPTTTARVFWFAIGV